jgi:hypothetical protein
LLLAAESCCGEAASYRPQWGKYTKKVELRPSRLSTSLRPSAFSTIFLTYVEANARALDVGVGARNHGKQLVGGSGHRNLRQQPLAYPPGHYLAAAVGALDGVGYVKLRNLAPLHGCRVAGLGGP